MRRFMTFAAAVLATAIWTTPATPQDQGEAPLPMDEVGLAWERPPSLARMARLYPRSAVRDGIGRGMARLACTTQPNRRIACRVIEEDPTGYGFGQAAVQVMDRAIVRTLDDRPPEGRTFLFTLRFGNWPPSVTPDQFHPVHAGLRWVRRPSMEHWDGVGQSRGETYSALYDCTARGDGALDCVLVQSSPANIDRFLAAAAETMAAARVRTLDGSSPEGVRFMWGLNITRQNN